MTSVAAEAPDLGTLGALVGACTACPALASARQRVVPGDFPDGARLLLVGEAPGAQEDAVGRPFVGRAGQLLDRLLVDAGLSRAEVAVANVLKCRPPGNRPPSRVEAGRCRGWLERQVELAAPSLVVTLGGAATGWAFGRAVRLGDVRGTVHRLARPPLDDRPLLATYHPSAAMRFGPRGAPMAALASDLALAAQLVRA